MDVCSDFILNDEWLEMSMMQAGFGQMSIFNPFNCMLVGPLDPATHLVAPHSELISHKTGLKNCFQFYLFCLMPENNSLETFGSYLLYQNFV